MARLEPHHRALRSGRTSSHKYHTQCITARKYTRFYPSTLLRCKAFLDIISQIIVVCPTDGAAPILTTGQDYDSVRSVHVNADELRLRTFLHSCAHRFGLHLSASMMAIRVNLSWDDIMTVREQGDVHCKFADFDSPLHFHVATGKLCCDSRLRDRVLHFLLLSLTSKNGQKIHRQEAYGEEISG